MNINEIESRTGLDRATIRYYERERLIVPARESNGYRNYSEADLEKLLKIKLLRALEFSLEDIRAMDADPSDFPDRLRARIRSLEAREAGIGDEKRVLDLMLADGARYESLDTPMYLASLDTGPACLTGSGGLSRLWPPFSWSRSSCIFGGPRRESSSWASM